MRYLLICGNDHWLQSELTEEDLKKSSDNIYEIYDIELKLFHVTRNTWQKI